MVTMPSAPDGIAHAISLALAPSFLLTAIGAILAMLTGRLGRVVDRARWIEQNYTPQPQATQRYPLLFWLRNNP